MLTILTSTLTHLILQRGWESRTHRSRTTLNKQAEAAFWICCLEINAMYVSETASKLLAERSPENCMVAAALC